MPTPARGLSTLNILDEISNFVFTSKYARYRDDLQRRETWGETVDRVEAMHLQQYADVLSPTDADKIKWAFDFVRDKKLVPSMRSMQYGGAPVFANNARIFNCAVRHVDSIRAFSELFYLLLSGCGVGAGLSKKFVSRIPALDPMPKTKTVTYTVEDTIEGWADSLEVLLQSYVKGNDASGCIVEFDFSELRPEGSPLKTSGGKAPGPEPLRVALDKVKALINSLIYEQGIPQLRPIDVCDILCYASDAVLSGGSRRSAMSTVFDKDDVLMKNAKVGEWFKENPQRARSNNSLLLKRGDVTLEELHDVVEQTRQWGEPGFVFANSEDVLYNPCFEVGFIPITSEGEPGVQMCNLTTINGDKLNTVEQFLELTEAAGIIGTLQAGYTTFPYLSDAAETLTKEESLLGVSILSMMNSKHISLDEELQRRGARNVVTVNKIWAKKIGINQASRCTVIKPDGTCGLALGTLASGIHPVHAQKMFKRIQVNKLDNSYQHFRMFNPSHCEESVWNSNGTDDVITFPVENPEGVMVKSDLTAIQHLEFVKSTQKNWVLEGQTESNKKDVTHNVSCTIEVADHEWQEVIQYLYDNREFFSAVSLVSKSLDKDYPQVPNEAVTTPQDESQFNKLYSQFVPVDYTLMIENEDFTKPMEEIACAGGACLI